MGVEKEDGGKAVSSSRDCDLIQTRAGLAFDKNSWFSEWRVKIDGLSSGNMEIPP